MNILFAILLVPLAYLSGSLPWAIWITRWVKGVDVRDAGSGHATTTNTFRQAGLLPALLVLGLDIAKGWLPVWLALRLGAPAIVLALVALAAAAGHCWPIFAGLRGGMGLATAGGAILALSPLGFLLGLAYLILMVLLLRHSARASVVVGATLPLLYRFFPYPFPPELVWVAAGAGVVIAVRFLIDWNRRYRELWLDRM
jgi:glycerol-3-phosphate acyltransferase PlsY